MWALLGTNFVKPALLAGAGAVAIPIAIWLFSRLRTQTVDWAAMEFLRRAMKKTQSRLRFENILLLLIRCLIIVLLAVAVARPRGKSIISTNDEAGKNILIVLDGSYSMGYQLGSTEGDTVFASARERATEIVRSLKDKDRVLIGLMSEQLQLLQDIPRVMNERGKIELLELLKDPDFEVTSKSASGPNLIRSVPTALAKFDAGLAPNEINPKSVIVLYDGQRSLFFKDDKFIDPSLTQVAETIGKSKGEFIFVDCSEPKPINVAVSKISTRNPIVGVGIPCVFDVVVQNFDSDPVDGLNVEFYVDDMETPVKTEALNLRGSERKTLPAFPYEFRLPGLHRVLVRFSSDKLTLDNSRSYIVDVREAVKIYALNGDPQSGNRQWDDELHYFRGAIEPRGPGTDLIRPSVYSESQFNEIEALDCDIVLVSNMNSLTELTVSRLESFAERGGVVVFTLGSQVDVDTYNEKLFKSGRGLLPLPLGEAIGRQAGARSTASAPEWELEIVDKNYAPFKFFNNKEMRKWLKYPGYFRLISHDDSNQNALKQNDENSRVIVDFIPRANADDNVTGVPTGRREPALVEKRFGRGKSIVFMSSIDADWNNAPAFDLFYVLFWRRLLLHLSQESRPQRQLAVGDTFEYLLTEQEYSKEARILRPDGRPTIQTPQELKDNSQRFRLTYDNTKQPGIYTVELTESPQRTTLFFSVNVDASEGNLEKLGPKELSEALPGVKIEQRDGIALKEALATQTKGSNANEFWRSVIYAVLALLVFESVLAMYLGRKRR